MGQAPCPGILGQHKMEYLLDLISFREKDTEQERGGRFTKNSKFVDGVGRIWEKLRR